MISSKRPAAKSLPAPLVLSLCLLASLVSSPSRADSVEQINAGSVVALETLRNHVQGVSKLLKRSAGVLVFPDVVKLGFGVGGEYGEGVLLVDGEPQAYYATSGAPFGMPLGEQIKSEVLVFRTQEALAAFQQRRSWQLGTAGTVVVFNPGPDASFHGRDIDAPVVGFVFSNEAMLENPTLVGAKITRLAR